jgi:hypothetical protein
MNTMTTRLGYDTTTHVRNKPRQMSGLAVVFFETVVVFVVVLL